VPAVQQRVTLGADFRQVLVRQAQLLLKPLALVGAGYETAGKIIGGVAFAATGFLLYRWILGMAAKRSA